MSLLIDVVDSKIVVVSNKEVDVEIVEDNSIIVVE
jgi:hypothetical protein